MNKKNNFKSKNLKKLNKMIKEANNKCSLFPSRLPAVNRIIVIGDLHGDWDATIESLKVAKLIDINNNWVGKDTVVVQLGDQIDRCRILPCNNPNSTKDDEASDIKILLFFTNLHKQAQKVGGAVYSVIGNHELMNVIGDMRYVSYENIKEFDNMYDNKSGMESRIEAFKPGNPLANFLACTRKMVLIIGTNLFVHGGIIPEMVDKYSIDEMNEKLMLFLQNKLDDTMESDILFNDIDKSPLWTRQFGFPIENDKECDNLTNKLKKKYGIERIFVGHTPQLNKGISNTCNGIIWQVDYGASKAFDTNNYNTSYKRIYQVLEIIKDGKKINYLPKNIEYKRWIYNKL